MREILFRGRQTDKDRWIYGVPVKGTIIDESEILIIESVFNCEEYICRGCEFTPVIAETIGQYTGLTDKNGKKIFEGDIVKIEDFTHGCALNYKQPTSNWVVHWREDIARFCIDYMSYLPFDFTETEVIGNIHDNPELLKGGAE